MGLIKEYVDQAVQTEADTVPSPYADPAVVLAAPPLTRHGLEQEAYASHSISELTTPPTSDCAYVAPRSPISPVLASLISRRLSQRRLVRCPPSEILNRRIVSMPEKRSDLPSTFFDRRGKRVVSMPDRVRPVLEPSAELSLSPSTVASDSFGSCSRRRERVRVFPAPSDVPQTPSPPSSPESLLIIAAGAQLPEGFLRKKYSPEPLIEEDEAIQIVLDWVTWANSPPRPIPALHGPLSLPYARCPSGAEGTIIEEPDNVAQMIWGLGPDDQPNNQIRAEGPPSHPDNTLNTHSHGPSHALPRLQKRKAPIQQVPRSSRLQNSAHSTHTKSSLARTQRQTHDDRHGLPSQLSSDVETHQDIVGGLSWNEGQSMPATSDNPLSDSDVLPVDNNRILEWQLARLRHALRTSLADMDSFSTYPGRFDPVIPAPLAPGFPQSYPRIFVEPRPNDSVIPPASRTSIELAQQYHQQQLCRQALQKQKLQVQSVLPTPPNSSSPQWSSHFSPYLTYCSTLSPELAGSPEHPISVPSQNYRSGAHASQYFRHVFDRHEHSAGHDFDTITNIPSAQAVPNVTASAASLRQSSSSSSTLAKYIKQLQALSSTAHLSPLQPAPPSSVPLPPLPSIDETTISPLQAIPTLPSPESPRTLSRGSSYHTARSFAPTRPMQRRLSSVPEEDSAFLELSTFVSPSRLPKQTTDHSSSSHDGTIGHRKRYLEVPPVELTQKTAVPNFSEFESNVGTPPTAFHETSPVKVRLPVNKEHNIREQANRQQDQGKGHRKKHRYKKLKGPITTNERARPCGLVG